MLDFAFTKALLGNVPFHLSGHLWASSKKVFRQISSSQASSQAGRPKSQFQGEKLVAAAFVMILLASALANNVSDDSLLLHLDSLHAVPGVKCLKKERILIKAGKSKY